MITHLTTPPAQAFFEDLDIDFTALREKQIYESTNGGPAIPLSKLDLAELEYRKFLALCRAYPQATIVPCKLVDEFWHLHILDTRAYREDCERTFGFFYDHFPYFGIRGTADSEALERAYAATLELYQHNFGLPPDGVWMTRDGQRCRTGCKPMKCK